MSLLRPRQRGKVAEGAGWVYTRDTMSDTIHKYYHSNLSAREEMVTNDGPNGLDTCISSYTQRDKELRTLHSFPTYNYHSFLFFYFY